MRAQAGLIADVVAVHGVADVFHGKEKVYGSIP